MTSQFGETRMIKIPVSQHSMFTSSFVDSYGCFLDDKQLKEAAKRINLHEELTEAFEYCLDYLIDKASSEGEMYKTIELSALLEKCRE